MNVSDFKTSATTSKPAAYEYYNMHIGEYTKISSLLLTLMVVPVSTKSTTASAKPNPQAASTEPDTYLIPIYASMVSDIKLDKLMIHI
jgi:hypothetical protein